MPYEAHSELTLPPDDTTLWRYMDFARFLQLLEQKSLWFSRPDQFDDPLEGTYTDGEVEHLRSLDANSAVTGLSISGGYLKGPKHMRTTAYVNCWRAGAGESLAMWDLYGKGSGIVAVKSNIGVLKQVLNESPHRTFLGEVKYVDWSLSPWDNNALVMCCRKDLSYQHEAEIRAIVWDIELINRNMSDALIAARLRSDYPQAVPDPFLLEKEAGVLGMEVLFDPERFITEIVVGPREKAWVAKLVENVLNRYSLKIKLSVSNRLTPR
jgi:hypothetical protein